MSDPETPAGERPGIDRRTLIKRAAATGAVAWTAPIIIDSLASPAAAITCASTCFRVTFPADNGGNCDLPSVAVAGACPTGTTGPGCSTTTDLPAGTTYSGACITPPSFCGTTTNFTGPFTLNAAAACALTACAPNRQFLAARALTNTGNCVLPNPTFSSPTVITWFRPANETWVNFTFVIGCSCT
jgi:hypothetical protein